MRGHADLQYLSEEEREACLRSTAPISALSAASICSATASLVSGGTFTWKRSTSAIHTIVCLPSSMAVTEKGLWNMGLDDDRDSFEEVHYGFCPGFWDDLCSKGRRLTMAWQRFILEAQL